MQCFIPAHMALESEVIKTSFSVYSEEMTDIMIDEFTAYTPQLCVCVCVCAFYRTVQSDN